MDPELEQEFFSNDPVLQEAAWKGELTPAQVAMIQEQLVSAGMTAEEAVDAPEELKTRLLQTERRKAQGEKDANLWENFKNNMDPGYTSAIVSGMVKAANAAAELVNKGATNAAALMMAPTFGRVGVKTFGEGKEIVEKYAEPPFEADSTTPEVPPGWEYALAEGATQFLAGHVVVNTLIPGSSLARLPAKAITEAQKGAIIAGTFFKANEPNLADMLAAFFDLDRDPETKISPVEETLRSYLLTQEDDSMAWGRLKNAVLDMPLSLAFDGVMAAFKGIKDKLVWGAKKLGDKISEPAPGQIGDPQSVKPTEQAVLVPVEERLAEEGYSPEQIQAAQEQVAIEQAARPIADAVDEQLIVDPAAFDNFLALQDAPPQQLYSKEGAVLPEQSAAQAKEEVRRGGQWKGLNWKYKSFDSPEDVMQIVDELTAAMRESLDRKLGDPATWDSDRFVAEQLNLDPRTLESIAGTLQLTRHQMIGYHIIQAQGMQHLKTLQKAVDDAINPDEQAVALVRVHEHFNMLATMHYWIAGAEQEMGRMLNAQKMPFDGSGDSTLFKAYVDSTGGQASYAQIKSLVEQMEVQREMGAPGVWLEQLKVASRTISRGAILTKDLVVDIAIQGMIGNLVTINRNLLGNSYAIADRLLVKQFAGLVPGSGVPLGEAMVQLRAMFRHWPDAVRRSTVALVTDQPKTKSFRKDFYQDTKKSPVAQAFDGKLVNSELFISDGISFLNNLLYVPGRVNMSMDEFYQSINIGMEREALAFRIAKELESNGSLSPGYTTNDVFNDIITRNQKAPAQVKSRYEELNQHEMTVAAQQTYAVPAGSTPSYFNKVHNLLRDLKENDPSGIIRILFPFYNTTVNLDKFALERIPGANLIIKQTQLDAFGMNGREKQVEALGKLFIGSGIMFTGFELAESGLHRVWSASKSGLVKGGMTAGFPPQTDPRKSTTEDTSRIPKRQYLIDSDWQPYSILREDGYISIAGLDPVTMLLQAGADANMLLHIYSSPEVQRGLFASDADFKSAVDASSEFFYYLVAAAKTKIDTRPLSKGVSDVLALADPDDFRKEAAYSNLMSNAYPLASFYQTLRSQWARADDRYQRNAKAREATEKSHKSWMRRNTALTDPTGEGGSKALNPRVNFMGDPFLHQIPFHLAGVDFSRVQAFFNVFRITPKDLNPVSERIHQLGGLSSDYPVRWKHILIDDASGKKKPFDLTDKQQYEWVKEATKLNRQTLPALVKGFAVDFPANKQREKLELRIELNKAIARENVMHRPGSSWAPIAQMLAGLKAASKRGEMGDLRPPEFYNTTGNPREPLQQFIESP